MSGGPECAMKRTGLEMETDREEQHFAKPQAVDLKKAKKKKKKPRSDGGTNKEDQDHLADWSEAASEGILGKRHWTPSDGGESSDRYSTDGDSTATESSPIACPTVCPTPRPGPKRSKTTSSTPVSNKPIHKHARHQCLIEADAISQKILNFCLDEKNPIQNQKTATIMSHVTDMRSVVSTLVSEIDRLTGSYETYRSLMGNAQPPSTHPSTPAIAAPSAPTTSYASIAGKNTPAQWCTVAARAGPSLRSRPAPSANITPPPQPLLAPNGVLPTPKPRLTQQVIAATKSAPAKHQIMVTPASPVDGGNTAAKRLIFQNVDLRKAHVGITSVRTTRDGGFIIETPHAKDLKLFTENAGLRNAGFNVSAPKSELPRISDQN